FNDRGSSGSQYLGKIEHAISRIGTRDHDIGERMADAALDGSARRLVIVGILTKDAGNQKRREELAGRLTCHGDAEALAEAVSSTRQRRCGSGSIPKFGIDSGQRDRKWIGYIGDREPKFS